MVETIVSGTPLVNCGLPKTSDKSDKTSFVASSDGVLSLLSSIFGNRNRWAPGGSTWASSPIFEGRQGLPNRASEPPTSGSNSIGFQVDCCFEDERPMSWPVREAGA